MTRSPPATTSPATSHRRSRLATACSHIGYQVWFPLSVYLITRLVDTVFILVAARHQIDLPRGAAFLGYGSVASNWDGHWYSSVASHGYPTAIPRDPAGHALQNQWGFYPTYPFLVGAIMRITGLGFTFVAPMLSFLLGAAAVTVMFRLLSGTLGRFAASATILLACTYMAAPAMQIAYTESLALLLLCTALLLLRNRRYGWLIPVLITLALTRAVALAFVSVVIAHGISRYRRRSTEPFPISDRWRVLGLAGLAVAATGLWPLIAAVTTGEAAAYTQTMSAWSTTNKLRVLIEFPAFAWSQGGATGLAVLLGILGLAAVLVLGKGASAWGPEVRAWATFYPIYLLLATSPGSSNVRHLFLAFPLMWPFPAEATSASERRRRTVMVGIMAVCGIILQWVWVSVFLVFTRLPEGPPFP